jgi:hypothetical protein
VGNLAPRYAEVIGAIKKSQMKVFAATPSRPGYNLPFQGNPGIVQASLGEWFNFDGLIKGSITLDTILNRIIDRVQTNYIATYKVDESMGFDPTIPLAARKIELKIKPGRNTIIDLQSIQSNLPNGREGYKKRFKIGTAKRIHRESLTVHINGQRQSAYEVLADGDLEFSNAPAPNSKIQITFSYLDLKDSVSLQPIILQDPNVRSLADLSVLLNGQLANPQDYDVAQTIEGFLSIRLNDSTLRSEDPYKVRENGGLDVKVYSGRIRVMKSN